MECTRCHSENVEGKLFCGDCGFPIAPGMAYLEERIAQQIDKQISTKFKDQRLVALETSDLVLGRITSQAKTYLWVAGIVVTLIITAFTAFGLKTSHDVWVMVHDAETQVWPKLDSAKHDAADAENAARDAKQSALQAKADIDKTSGEVTKELTDAAKIGAKVSHLSDLVADNAQRVSGIDVRSRQVEQNLAQGLGATSTLALQTRSDLELGIGSGAFGLNNPSITTAMLVERPSVSTVDGSNFGNSPGRLYVEIQHIGTATVNLTPPTSLEVKGPFSSWTSSEIRFVLSAEQYQAIKANEPKADTPTGPLGVVPNLLTTSYTNLTVRVVTSTGNVSILSPIVSWPQ